MIPWLMWCCQRLNMIVIQIKQPFNLTYQVESPGWYNIKRMESLFHSCCMSQWQTNISTMDSMNFFLSLIQINVRKISINFSTSIMIHYILSWIHPLIIAIATKPLSKWLCKAMHHIPLIIPKMATHFNSRPITIPLLPFLKMAIMYFNKSPMPQDV